MEPPTDRQSGATPELLIETNSGRYPIFFGIGAEDALEREITRLQKERIPYSLVTDRNIAASQQKLLARFSTKALILPPGEQTKSLDSLATCWDHFSQCGLDRGGQVFAVGGGVIGDLAGFAAATYLRGVDFQQVPTTLLAMVDSSVGGKTGINTAYGKNLVGAFWQPRAVYAMESCLTTLPPREFSAGIAEVIKYGLLGDADLFFQLENRSDPLGPGDADLPAVIRRCCEQKGAIVKADERETAGTGGRALLNLGHTFAHALENIAGYGEYLHGEAVAIGLCLAARYSEERGWLDETIAPRIKPVLQSYDLPVKLRSPLPAKELVAAMGRDKKVLSGQLRLVALRNIGEAFTAKEESLPLLHSLWHEFGAAK